ncbi:hypothetical protein DQ04_04451070 [Trypanosoma grayi]|uniref:hypothetical protein n=1 Tax=Trypanosoma grayi TaxID=71804 RepID=UPI0004F474F7|nr:hypothetical protein DQ04_04451070 [Trypanosoma grayi]KEG09916.1 hypothetical protein DQ04_04451070 [Trypanosoma grayi]
MMNGSSKSSTTEPSGPVKGDGTYTSTTVLPWDSLCEDIIGAYKAGQDIVVLQRFEELQAMPELDALVSAQPPDTATGSSSTPEEEAAALEKVEFCWGRALLAAKRIAGGDDEHIVTIVESFEERFERASDYLRVLAITADSALEVLRIHQLVEGHVSTDAVTAALHKFPTLDADEMRELIAFLQQNDVALTKKVAEQLEKRYVMRMKSEDAEDVFREMLAAGVEPVSTRPYNFIFMKSGPFKYMGLLNYYEDMLDRGIVPENSTFRILSKQTQNDGVANQHFSSLAWGNMAPHRRHDEDTRGGTQAFFSLRLEELARTKPETSLDTALQVFRRMEVEGTPLTNGSPVLSVLLRLFCRQGHPEDTKLVLRLTQERGCRPTSVTLQKLLKSRSPDRFNQAEIVLQRVAESGEVLQVDCVDLLRHFVVNNVRGKAVRVFSAFVVQGYRHPNEPVPFAIASMAMKLGPFDWALGVLALLLASVDKPLGRGVQSRMRYAAHDSRSREVLAVLERCDWKRERLLLADELQDHASGNRDNNSNNSNGVNGGDATRAGPNIHSRLDGGPTWLSSMHVALKEMGVEHEVIESYKTALVGAIEKAKRHHTTV